MTHILSILRAAHCRSTHHYFAIDALRNMQTAQAQRLANILLKHHDEYLVGAKAPDSNFKDFQNHVIHVEQGNWGGAALKCQEWLLEARQHLDNRKWKKAAYACGVLSHYFTDPFMPLHTAQTSREAAIHRPLEWCIYQNYGHIYDRSTQATCEFKFSVDENWISKAVSAAAQVANQHYATLVESFDLKEGLRGPQKGLTENCVEILAELFALAIGGLSAVFTKLADETTAELPQVSLSLASLLATIDKPLAWLVKRFSDSSERRAVQAIINEYQKTGTVQKQLPAEVIAVDQARIKQPRLGLELSYSTVPNSVANTPEIGSSTSDSQRLSNVVQIDSKTDDVQSSNSSAEIVSSARSEALQQDTIEATNSAFASMRENDAAVAALSTESELNSDVTHRPFNDVNSDSNDAIFLPLSQARSRPTPVFSDRPAFQKRSENPASNSQDQVASQPQESEHGRPGLRIAPGTELVNNKPAVKYDSPLQDAPSIGPKTAKRFEKIGIETIRQLVESNVEEVVAALSTRWITVPLVKDWQDQARLVCEVPALTGYRAQLLVAVGCRTSWQLRTANSSELNNQLEQFCQTAEGQHILRSASTPVGQEVVQWIESARKYARREAA